MALFREVAEVAEQLAGEPGKLKKRAAIAETLRRIHEESPHSDDTGLAALWLAGTPFAEADSRKLNAGGALLTRALLEVSGVPQIALTAAYRKHGDLGAAAFDLLQHRTDQNDSAPLTLAEIAETFTLIASARTTAIRSALVEGLLRRSTPLEAKYLLKLISGDMRIGVKQSLVEEAIAQAAAVPVASVRHAVMLEADLASAVRRAFTATLEDARMKLFHPLGFMLASPVASPEEAVERFSGKPSKDLEEGIEQVTIDAFLEDKYDGMRVQLHCGERVAIYSRNREDVTESYPELAEAFARVHDHAGLDGLGGLVLDGEILGWDYAASRALPFAVLGQRIGRKKVSNEWRRQVPVIFMAFDLMAANGELLLDLPLRERRNRLEAVVEKLVEVACSPLAVDERKSSAQTFLFAAPEGEGLDCDLERLMLAPSRTVESAADIERAYAEARARANEGVMIKAAQSRYTPGRRGLEWVKLKRELATLDVVVTGAEFGHGRRAGILSDYTFAVRGPSGDLLNVGKAYSGLTDAEIARMSQWMMDHTLEDQGYFRTVEPLKIIEVAFNNIMRSDRHASGFALRFPRIVRIRDDKPLSEIDTLARVEEVYRSQVDRPGE